ncbi:MAG TPA: hypothetical protein VNW95_14505 [Mucilaginibacter sp.]|nr:hypothetical protein [Mucilaginibacter sp.]
MTKGELLYSLTEQLYFLDKSLSNFSKFDNVEDFENKVIGNPFKIKINTEIEAKRLATIIRILLHDTNNSISLLTSLSIKDNIKYIDSTNPNDGRLHSMSGMKGVQGSNPNQYLGLVAKVNTGNSLVAVPLFKQHLPEWYQNYARTDFKQWWNTEIININGHKQTRDSLMRNIANKDGGAHIQGSLPEEYHIIKNSALSLKIQGIQTAFEKSVVYASIAQIAWELLNSIDDIQ